MTGVPSANCQRPIDASTAPLPARHSCSGLSFELDLVAQRDPVGAHRGDLRLEAGTAAINGTAVHPHQAEAAALVETQRINVVVGGNDPQPGAPLPPAGGRFGRRDDGRFGMASGAVTSAVIASEPLTKHTAGWLEAPEYSMLVFTPAEDGSLAVDTRELA